MRRSWIVAALPIAVATAAVSLSSPGHSAGAERSVAGSAAQVARGRTLYVEGCAACHGLDAHGTSGKGPTLIGAGAAAADFYLSTGRMPLDVPSDPPHRSRPAYGASDQAALVAYVGSLGGPGVPHIDAASGEIAAGFRAFTANCAGCHQVGAQGGIVTGGVAPSLDRATDTQIAEAIRIGPYLMPRFGPGQIDDRTLASIVRYVHLTRHPDDRGGWGLGHVGPIPEGMVAWLLGMAALVLIARLIGERTE